MDSRAFSTRLLLKILVVLFKRVTKLTSSGPWAARRRPLLSLRGWQEAEAARPST